VDSSPHDPADPNCRCCLDIGRGGMLRRQTLGSTIDGSMSFDLKKLRVSIFCGLVAAVLAVGECSAGELTTADIDGQLKILAKVGSQGAGSAEAREARRKLAADCGADALPQIFLAMDTKNIVAANWARSVYEEVVRRELAKPEPKFPVSFVQEFVRDGRHEGRPRRLGLELLNRIDPKFGPAIVPTLVDDAEFRDDAIAALIAAADADRDAGKKEQAIETYRKAFAHARESSQVTGLADRLSALGEKANIVEHLGFIVDWLVVGPFDAPEKTSYDLKFPPEVKIDLDASYPGQGETEIRWKPARTEDRMGLLDLAQAIAPAKEAVAYAYAELESPKDSAVQLRCSADDNLSVWLNGEKVFGRPQWLNGTRLDRFVTPVTLRAGKNRLLVKVCQGPQHSDPAVGNAWSMQLRFCTEDGAGVRLEQILPAVESKETPK
jgi:hypothetical protein